MVNPHCSGLYPHNFSGIGCPICAKQHSFIARLQHLWRSLTRWMYS